MKYEKRTISQKKVIFYSSLLFVILIFISLLSLSIGTISIPFIEIINILLGKDSSEESRIVIINLRLPRILLAILVGSGLSVSGSVFQAILRNPLAEPYILGISSGAAVGTLISIALGFNIWFFGTPILAFSGSLLVVILVFFLGRRFGVIDSNILLLSGVMVGAFLSAIVLFLLTVIGQPIKSALLWLLGSFANAELNSVLLMFPIVLIPLILLFFNSYKLNIIALGDDTSMQLGINTEKIKKISYISASIVTGSLVSLSGPIGFVGLIIPHICRILFGPDHRLLLPTSFFAGAIFLVLIDIPSRMLFSDMELPIGALTAIIGAPIFVFLLKRR